MRAELCVPLKVGQRVIGVINAESHIVGNFTEDDERLLMTVANQLATGIEKARLFAEITRALDREQRLNEIARTISGALDMATIIKQCFTFGNRAGRCRKRSVVYAFGGSQDTYHTHMFTIFPVLDDEFSYLLKRTGLAWHIIESGYFPHPVKL